ncbi:hypothetical protein CEXT_546481 [Caerostris extrusa]|uniref:Uncharacterized protein n=1 Tax=Caerostris extrusa TaxID=172846 RepID=A0AAV4TR66_CAEEX|nr:hypothetical protein CEXT_546481 [Caerostris extrusa]
MQRTQIRFYSASSMENIAAVAESFADDLCMTSERRSRKAQLTADCFELPNTQPETPALFVTALIKLQRAGNL